MYEFQSIQEKIPIALGIKFTIQKPNILFSPNAQTSIERHLTYSIKLTEIQQFIQSAYEFVNKKKRKKHEKLA